VEIGKARIKRRITEQGATLTEFQGWETQEIRKRYAYRKSSDKAADRFEAHCSDALALAVAVGRGVRVEPGPFVVVDDTYRPVRRQLHDTQPARGGVRAAYSRGTIFGVRKGVSIGTVNGRIGRLCGEYLGGYRYQDERGKRQCVKRLAWISTHFVTRGRRSAASAVS
jgi:hypothetical protein